MLRPSDKLEPYIDFDNRKLIISKDLPKELEKEAKEFEKAYNAMHKKNTLAEY